MMLNRVIFFFFEQAHSIFLRLNHSKSDSLECLRVVAKTIHSNTRIFNDVIKLALAIPTSVGISNENPHTFYCKSRVRGHSSEKIDVLYAKVERKVSGLFYFKF